MPDLETNWQDDVGMRVTAAYLNDLDTKVNTHESSISGLNAKLNGLSFVTLSASDYSALATKDASTVYIVTP